MKHRIKLSNVSPKNFITGQILVVDDVYKLK